jgi:pimeloyl-ACP methyl ester carboxylesterase
MNTQPVLNGSENTLIVFLHAYSHSPKNLEAIVSASVAEFPNAHILCPVLPTSVTSTKSPNSIVIQILEEIDLAFKATLCNNRQYKRIILVGHSLGALLARKVYVVACGERAKAPFGPEYDGQRNSQGTLVPAREWAHLVTRIVLLAGINRGWRISHHLNIVRAPLWAIGLAFAHIMRAITGRTFLITTIRQGAEFITELRIQWICMRQDLVDAEGLEDDDRRAATGTATTIQLLGSQDDLVGPEDNIDLVSGGDFYYLDVPKSGHENVIALSDPAYGPERKRLFLLALSGTVQQLEAESIVPSDDKFISPNFAVRRVVFVIHGIRDAGYWTHKIARRIKRRAGPSLSDWATETSSYGYFPMLPFIFPWYRRRKVEWLMDQYTEALARFPNATFSYVGHSNGTYLIAKALQLYPCCMFDNIVFAGSVVSVSYDWRTLLDTNPPRVNAVLNLVASRDWVVAFFPKLFQMFRLQDLGSAGHDGFRLAGTTNVHERRYIDGGHGAAIGEEQWNLIADFVLSGNPPSEDGIPNQVSKRSWFVRAFGSFPPVVWLIIATFVASIWLGMILVIKWMPLDPVTHGIAIGVGTTVYCLIIWLAITRL